MIKSRRATTPADGGKSCDNCRMLKRGRYHGAMIARCSIDGATHGGGYDLRKIICDKHKEIRE